MNTKNKKLLNKNNPENTLVCVGFVNNFKEEFECVGVLIKEQKDSIRVGFSAKNDKLVDYVDIKRSDILNINILNSSSINKL
ncbi:MAG: hypothetical protein WC657_04570 [Candidatus Paceibacterota bacterium]|jgi:hypothetical protein